MADANEMLQKVREKKPLIHHITNWVSIYECASITRAFGALPVMAHAEEEAADMARISSALVLNIGTLSPDFISAMLLAGKEANSRGIPIILDAVGAGATHYRTNEAKRLLSSLKITVLKGNAGEIAALSGIKSVVHGVESVSAAATSLEIAKSASKLFSCTVAITGKQDVVASGESVYAIDNGCAMMGSVVGTGCMSASVIGAFCAVERDSAHASACALACFGIAGELAAASSSGPGSFVARLFDEAYKLDSQKVSSRAKVRKL